MLDPSKCLNFVLGANACIESALDCVTVRSVAAYPTPRRLRTRLRQPPGTCAVGIYGRIVWTIQLSHSEISWRELPRSFWRFLYSSAGPARWRVAGQACRCRPKNASGRRLLPFAKGCSRKTQTPRSIVKRGFPLSWRCCSGCCVSASLTGKFETRQSQARQATVSECTAIIAMQRRTPGNSLVL